MSKIFYTNKGIILNDQTKDLKTKFSMKLLLNPCIGFFEMQLEEVLILRSKQMIES